MTETVTVWGVKDTVTIPEQHGAILKATFTVVNPEQISEASPGQHPEIDLDRVTFLKQEDGKYTLIRGKLEEVLAQSMDKLVNKKTVTVSFGLEVRDCPLKNGMFGTNQTPPTSSNSESSMSRINIKFIRQEIKNMRLKAIAQRSPKTIAQTSF